LNAKRQTVSNHQNTHLSSIVGSTAVTSLLNFATEVELASFVFSWPSAADVSRARFRLDSKGILLSSAIPGRKGCLNVVVKIGSSRNLIESRLDPIIIHNFIILDSQ
jgi:hypothetical protein